MSGEAAHSLMLALIDEVLDSGAFILGPNVKAFGFPSSTIPSRTRGTPASRQRRATIAPTGCSVS